MCTKSVTVLVAVSKMGVVFIKVGVKVNEQYSWDILLSQQMLDAIIVSFMTILSFSKTVHWSILCSTQSSCCSAKLSYQSIKHLLTPYFLSNINAKNNQNCFIYVRVIARQGSDIFGTQCSGMDSSIYLISFLGDRL